jgi:hypothetical protein
MTYQLKLLFFVALSFSFTKAFGSISLTLEQMGSPLKTNNYQPFTITSAKYGVLSSSSLTKDITTNLQTLAAQGLLFIPQDLNSIVGDPAPGKTKQLKIVLTIGSSSYSLTISEGWKLPTWYSTTATLNLLSLNSTLTDAQKTALASIQAANALNQAQTTLATEKTNLPTDIKKLSTKTEFQDKITLYTNDIAKLNTELSATSDISLQAIIKERIDLRNQLITSMTKSIAEIDLLATAKTTLNNEQNSLPTEVKALKTRTDFDNKINAYNGDITTLTSQKSQFINTNLQDITQKRIDLRISLIFQMQSNILPLEQTALPTEVKALTTQIDLQNKIDAYNQDLDRLNSQKKATTNTSLQGIIQKRIDLRTPLILQMQNSILSLEKTSLAAEVKALTTREALQAKVDAYTIDTKNFTAQKTATTDTKLQAIIQQRIDLRSSLIAQMQASITALDQAAADAAAKAAAKAAADKAAAEAAAKALSDAQAALAAEKTSLPTDVSKLVTKPDLQTKITAYTSDIQNLTAQKTTDPNLQAIIQQRIDLRSSLIAQMQASITALDQAAADAAAKAAAKAAADKAAAEAAAKALSDAQAALAAEKTSLPTDVSKLVTKPDLQTKITAYTSDIQNLTAQKTTDPNLQAIIQQRIDLRSSLIAQMQASITALDQAAADAAAKAAAKAAADKAAAEAAAKALSDAQAALAAEKTSLPTDVSKLVTKPDLQTKITAYTSDIQNLTAQKTTDPNLQAIIQQRIDLRSSLIAQMQASITALDQAAADAAAKAAAKAAADKAAAEAAAKTLSDAQVTLASEKTSLPTDVNALKTKVELQAKIDAYTADIKNLTAQKSAATDTNLQAVIQQRIDLRTQYINQMTASIAVLDKAAADAAAKTAADKAAAEAAAKALSNAQVTLASEKTSLPTDVNALKTKVELQAKIDAYTADIKNLTAQKSAVTDTNLQTIIQQRIDLRSSLIAQMQSSIATIDKAAADKAAADKAAADKAAADKAAADKAAADKAAADKAAADKAAADKAAADKAAADKAAADKAAADKAAADKAAADKAAADKAAADKAAADKAAADKAAADKAAADKAAADKAAADKAAADKAAADKAAADKAAADKAAADKAAADKAAADKAAENKASAAEKIIENQTNTGNKPSEKPEPKDNAADATVKSVNEQSTLTQSAADGTDRDAKEKAPADKAIPEKAAENKASAAEKIIENQTNTGNKPSEKPEPKDNAADATVKSVNEQPSLTQSAANPTNRDAKERAPADKAIPEKAAENKASAAEKIIENQTNTGNKPSEKPEPKNKETASTTSTPTIQTAINTIANATPIVTATTQTSVSSEKPTTTQLPTSLKPASAQTTTTTTTATKPQTLNTFEARRSNKGRASKTLELKKIKERLAVYTNLLEKLKNTPSAQSKNSVVMSSNINKYQNVVDALTKQMKKLEQEINQPETNTQPSPNIEPNKAIGVK